MEDRLKDVWKALAISNDDFIQTSEPRHHAGCRAFTQKVCDNGDTCAAFRPPRPVPVRGSPTPCPAAS